MNHTPTIVRRADDAYQGLRELNHLTAHGAMPAPVLYDVLGTLKRLGPALDQLLGQLGDALEQSLVTSFPVIRGTFQFADTALMRRSSEISGLAVVAHPGAALRRPARLVQVGHRNPTPT